MAFQNLYTVRQATNKIELKDLGFPTFPLVFFLFMFWLCFWARYTVMPESFLSRQMALHAFILI
jgi:hypothetical protein